MSLERCEIKTMSNRLALVGVLIATAFVAAPSVAGAQNPWRADPQANGQYMVPPAPQAAPKPLPEPLPQPFQVPQTYDMPKYAPLDGNVDGEDRGYMARPGGAGLPFGSEYVRSYGYGGSGYAGPGYGMPGFSSPYGASPYLGGPGFPGGYSGGYPGLGWGGNGPNNGLNNSWGNNYGGPLSWMPFW